MVELQGSTGCDSWSMPRTPRSPSHNKLCVHSRLHYSGLGHRPKKKKENQKTKKDKKRKRSHANPQCGERGSGGLISSSTLTCKRCSDLGRSFTLCVVRDDPRPMRKSPGQMVCVSGSGANDGDNTTELVSAISGVGRWLRFIRQSFCAARRGCEPKWLAGTRVVSRPDWWYREVHSLALHLVSHDSPILISTARAYWRRD